jgi:hypothetical protein
LTRRVVARPRTPTRDDGGAMLPPPRGLGARGLDRGAPGAFRGRATTRDDGARRRGTGRRATGRRTTTTHDDDDDDGRARTRGAVDQGTERRERRAERERWGLDERERWRRQGRGVGEVVRQGERADETSDGDDGDVGAVDAERGDEGDE